MAFCVAKGKPVAKRARRGFAKAKIASIHAHFLLVRFLCAHKENERIARSSLQGCEQNLSETNRVRRSEAKVGKIRALAHGVLQNVTKPK